jgi:hypothetical protein
MIIFDIIKVKILMFIKWESCWPLSLEWSLYFEHAIQSPLYTRFFGADY